MHQPQFDQAQFDAAEFESGQTAATAVHYVVCTATPGPRREADFLAAVARARDLVTAGARRIVFLIAGDASDTALQRSLVQFARHVGRTMPSRPVDFAVMPLAGAGPSR